MLILVYQLGLIPVREQVCKAFFKNCIAKSDAMLKDAGDFGDGGCRGRG